ncbi:Bacterial protein of uncharacterized function (Gcw_chp) OS=Afipia felis OX=1035 GN=NCTC12722_03512 PE=4 SV=1 [Afipia felis]
MVGVVMKSVLPTAAVAVSLLGAQAAVAADLPVKAYQAPVVAAFDPWDIAFGAGIMNDYVFRGITQSNHKPSVTAYFEPRYNVTKDLQFYVGSSFESISFTNRAAAEVDIYGGVRPTFGALALDFGVWGYLYPGGQCIDYVPGGGVVCPLGANALLNGNAMKKDVSFYEAYAKANYTFNDYFTLGGTYFYSPNFLNFGFDSSYASITGKLTAPSGWLPNGIGSYLSGEFGRQWLGTTDAFYLNTRLPDYNTWNVGIGFTYKVFTLDLRYSDTNLAKTDCNAITSAFTASSTDPASGLYKSNWCGASFIAKLSADLTLMNNIK